jgi:hypothetical protein
MWIMWPQTAVRTWIQFQQQCTCPYRRRERSTLWVRVTARHRVSRAYKMYRNCEKQKCRGHFTYTILIRYINYIHSSRWLRFLRHRSAAALLLGLRVRIPPGSMYICFLWMFCVVRYRPVWRADHSSRGILPGVMCLGMVRSNNKLLRLQ